MTPEALLARLVSIPSVSGQEEACVDALHEALEELGLKPERQGCNVLCRVGQGSRRFLGVSHLDTVPAAQGWPGDPWAGVWSEGKLVGLGANDAKGCVVALVFAAATLGSIDGEATFAFTVEEETGGPNGIQAFLATEAPFDGAIVGEPTSLEVVVAQRGMLMVRMEAHGEAGHIAHGRDNAIFALARDLVKLESWRFEPDPFLGETRPQVATIQGGQARNQMPERVEAFIDFRTTPNLSHDAILARMREELESPIIMHSERYRPRSVDPSHPIVQAALAASGQAKGVGSNTVSDWAFLDAPAVKMGPGDTRRSHTAGEYLLASELEAGIRVYRDTIRRFFDAVG